MKFSHLLNMTMVLACLVAGAFACHHHGSSNLREPVPAGDVRTIEHPHHHAPHSEGTSLPGAHHHHGGPLQAGELKPLMQEMLEHMSALQGALNKEDAVDAAQHAERLASICGDGDEELVADPGLFGAKFAQWDHQLHSTAARLSEQASAGDLASARKSYNGVAEACAGCHAQAPVASDVGLGALVTPYE